MLQGSDPDFSEVSLDAGGVPGFNRRVYEDACAIPRGETRTYHEIAKALGASGAAHSVAQAIAKNPYMIIVPCHRVLEAGNYADRISPYGGVISKRRLLALEGAHPVASKTLFEVLLPVAPPRSAYLDRWHGCDHAADHAIDDGLRVSLRCGTGRQAVRGVPHRAFHCLCPLGQLRLPVPRRLLRAGGGLDAGRRSRRGIHLHA